MITGKRNEANYLLTTCMRALSKVLDQLHRGSYGHQFLLSAWLSRPWNVIYIGGATGTPILILTVLDH